MGNPAIAHIPFRLLEDLGLIVQEDRRDRTGHLRDTEIGEAAVDAWDHHVRVVTKGNHLVFDAAQDRFADFHRAMWQAARGEPVTWRRDARVHLRSVSFAGGTIRRSTHAFLDLEASFTTSLWTRTTFYYLHQQPVLHEEVQAGDADQALLWQDGPIPPDAVRDRVRITDTDPYSRTRREEEIARFGDDIQRDITLHDTTGPHDTSLGQFADATAVRVARRERRVRFANTPLLPQPWGWLASVHGVNVRVYTDPRLGADNTRLMQNALDGLEAIPAYLLQGYRDERARHINEPFVAIYIADLTSEEPAPDVVSQAFDPLLKAVFGSDSTAAHLPPAVRHLMASGMAAWKERTGTVAVYMHAGEQIILLSPWVLHSTTAHEVGHAVETLLGPDFSRALAAFFAQYQEAMFDDLGLDPAERTFWHRAQQTGWRRLSPARRQQWDALLERAVTAGWLPRSYTGSEPAEFWADLFAMAMLGSRHDLAWRQPRHFLRLVEHARYAIFSSRSTNALHTKLTTAWREHFSR